MIDRIGAGSDDEYGILQISHRRRRQTIDLNVLLSAAINFILVAAVVYFLVVVPYNTAAQEGRGRAGPGHRARHPTEIRNLLADEAGKPKQVTGPGTGPSPDTAETTSADRVLTTHTQTAPGRGRGLFV